jgi:pimeloyl-ACP methyl ester carboxylesterase
MDVSTSAGVRLHTLVDGPADAPVTVVLAHGWTLDARSWGPVAVRLADPGSAHPARVVRYDHRGHGRSDLPARADMTLELLADDLAELIDRMAPAGPLVLAGHSMGGMTIMALAERYPELVARRVAGVALVATASGGLADSTLGLSVRMLGLVRRGEAKLADAAWVDRRARLTRRPALLAPGVRALVVGRRADRGALRTTVRCIADCRPAAMVGFRPTFNTHERDAALAAFAGIPTEVLVGTRDKLTPPHQSRRIVAAAPHARLTVYPDAGHMLPLERVDGVTAKLSALVAAASATAATAATTTAATTTAATTAVTTTVGPVTALERAALSRETRGPRGAREFSGSAPTPARPAWT